MSALNSKHKTNNSGFTIIEIIITITIAFVILIIIYDVYLMSQKTFRLADTKLELIQNGRIVLDRLSRELRQTPDIVTKLPPTKEEIGFPPPNEIQFQDGHDASDIQYLQYSLFENILKRQRIAYFFPEESEIYVYWNAEDEFGGHPEVEILDDKIIAEYIENMSFYGTSLINIEIWLSKGDILEHLYTAVWGRNTS